MSRFACDVRQAEVVGLAQVGVGEGERARPAARAQAEHALRAGGRALQVDVDRPRLLAAASAGAVSQVFGPVSMSTCGSCMIPFGTPWSQ